MSNMSRRSSELLHLHYEVLHHDSGLTIYVFPLKRVTTYAALVAKYGAFDSSFRIAEHSEPITVPAGIAHFLEHKLFEEEDGTDAFEKFARTGADANAFTSDHMTEYVFSCTDRFEESLAILLKMVTVPHFTKQNVEKETGIIEQEIRMGEDDPDESLYYGMIRALYHHSPLRIPIAGTVESIRQITPELLNKCHHIFYNLHNLSLFVCGDVTSDQVAAVADRCLQPVPTISVEQFCPSEPSDIVTGRYYREMETSIPCFSIGIKDPDILSAPVERLKRLTLTGILGQILFSRSSGWVNKMISDGKLTSDPNYGFTCTEKYAHYEITGESDDPEAFFSCFLDYIESMKRTGIDKKAFERAKKVYYASSIAPYNNTISTANKLIEFEMDGAEIFTEPDVILSSTLDDVNETFRNIFDETKTVFAIVAPFGTRKNVGEANKI